MLWKVATSVGMYFHNFDIKSLAGEDFILYFGYKARHHALIDAVNHAPTYLKCHFTVKTRK